MSETDRAGSPAASAAPLGGDMVGAVIAGELTIERRLAEGGMGAVFVAMQGSTGKRRALKLMHREIASDAEFQRRFVQEAQVGARIQSEHVVDVLAAGVDAPSGLPYLVMELLEGEDLRHRLARSPLSVNETRDLLEQLCHAMTAAHAVGVVHRDLKPENIFLQRARRAGAGAFTVKVLDFGIAKLLLEASTRSTRGTVGSPLWMAPEQTTPGPVTAAADVWAIGLIAYEMLVGKSFWRTGNREDGNTVQLLREIVLEPLPSARERAAEYALDHRLPLGFDEWFARCVCREPSGRFQDASALWRFLPPLLASGTSSLAATGEALAATMATTPPGLAHASAPTPATEGRVDKTGAPTPFVAGVSTPPNAGTSGNQSVDVDRPGGVRPETPLASVREVDAIPSASSSLPSLPSPSSPSTPSTRSDRRVRIAGAIAVASIGIAVFSLVRSNNSPAVELQPPAAPTSVVAARSSEPPAPSAAPSSVASSTVTPSSAPTASMAGSASAATPKVAADPKPPVAALAPPASHPLAAPSSSATTSRASTLPGGFSDPSDRNGAVTWKVQDRRVRLFVRLVSNDSNVADAVVRKAIEHSSWEYLRCYERAFGGAKDLPEATVTVGFDILDQLPRFGKLVSSTNPSKTFNDCVVGTLIGQTINAAGPDGKGHAVESFRFLPN